MTKTFLFEHGFKKIQKEIEHIRNVMIPDVKKRLEIAHQVGDVEASKLITEEHEFYTHRIPYLENMLATAKVVKTDAEKKAEALIKEFNRPREYIGHTSNEIFQLGMQQALETVGIGLPWTRLK